MLRHVLVMMLAEVAAIVLIMSWTYCYPCPPVFSERAEPPFYGPQWYQEWRYGFDGHRFINSMVWDYHNPSHNYGPKPKMVAFSEPLIEAGFWLLFARACVSNGLEFAVIAPIFGLLWSIDFERRKRIRSLNCAKGNTVMPKSFGPRRKSLSPSKRKTI